jgi:hypothetical protein
VVGDDLRMIHNIGGIAAQNSDARKPTRQCESTRYNGSRIPARARLQRIGLKRSAEIPKLPRPAKLPASAIFTKVTMLNSDLFDC